MSQFEPPNIWRTANGVPHVEVAGNEHAAALQWGLGFCHGRDRGMQMLLTRLIGRGQASQFLQATNEMLAVDTFFRRMNWAGNTSHQIDALTDDARVLCEAYCSGVNAAFQKFLPIELRLLGYDHSPWTLADTIMMFRMIGYVTLAQSQGEVERLIVEMVQAGVTRVKLEELFPELLGGLDEAWLRRVKLHERIVPPTVLWQTGVGPMMASNNWVVNGKMTKSGKPMLANDPHLEVNRLPNVWYEAILSHGARKAMGATMPGVPGILIGRNPDLAWGVTYSFLDGIDSWIEQCQEGSYLRNDKWIPFEVRKETIQRKRNGSVEITVYENDHGILDGDPTIEGCYLATRWATGDAGALSLSQVLKLCDARTAAEGMEIVGKIECAFNWVFADVGGDIGYQMSGLMPRRSDGVSGLIPLPGWLPENDWKGFVSHEELPRCFNPPDGFFVTANQDLNAHGKAKPINMPMGSYRADRIAALLQGRKNLDVGDMAKIQLDVFSRQAEKYMEIVRALLPDTPEGRELKAWDCCYDVESRGASLFESFYWSLFREVFGRNGIGEAVFDHLTTNTGIFIDFYGNFDRILLSESSEWFGGESRDQIYRRALEQALRHSGSKWGDQQKVMMTHILVGGKLPSFLGFDRGPITLMGGRATPHQGQIYRGAWKATTFSPSYRLVANLAEEVIHTNLAGGPSDRRYSKWYVSDLQNWVEHKLKVIGAASDGQCPF